MLKKIIVIIIFFYTLIIFTNFVFAESATANFAGRILLQVQDKGQAWYIYPKDGKRYSLGRPADAFNIMRKLSIGINNKNLAKIPIGFIKNDYLDSDADGIYDNLEDNIGTDKNKVDSDNDSYNDKVELTDGYNPLGAGKLPIDRNFTKLNSGKIFLQVEKNGQAWYVEPMEQKRYFLGRPDEAFKIMQIFGLGITNADLEKIPIGYLSTSENNATTTQNNQNTNIEATLQSAATAIRAINIPETLKYFSPNMHKSIEYSMQNMTEESLLMLANILSGSTLEDATENKRTYKNEVYFQGEKHTVHFYVEKQSDGTWLMTNL